MTHRFLSPRTSLSLFLAVIATAVLTGLPLFATVGHSPASAGDIIPAGSATRRLAVDTREVPPPDRAGQARATATISVTLYGSSLDWYGEPGTLVYASVVNDGLAGGRAYQVVSDQSGRAHMRLDRATEPGALRRSGGILRPKDDVVVIAAGYAPITVTLPLVAADIDAAGDRIGGVVPRSSRVRLTVRDPGTGAVRLDREIDADVDGGFLLAAGAGVDLRHTDGGEVIYTDPEGHRIRGSLVAPRVDIELGQRVRCVGLRDGQLNNIEVRDPEGRLKFACGRVIAGGNADETVLAGDLVTLPMGPGFLVPGMPPSVSLRVPDLNLTFDLLAQSVHGEGPPDRSLEITFGSAFRTARRQAVRTDAQGRFSLPAPTDPGAVATVRLDAQDGFTVQQTFRLSTVLVGLHNALFAAFGGSSSEPVDLGLTLTDATGGHKSDQYLTLSGTFAESPWSGDWGDLGEPGSGLAAQPGDRLEVQLGNEAPVALEVPAIVAGADAAGNTISGTAPPGSDLVITFAGTRLADPLHPPVQAKADAMGRFQVDLGGRVDLRPGMWGLVATWSPASPVAFYGVWTAQRLDLDLNTGRVEGIGALSETFRVALRDAAGKTLFEGEDSASGVLSFADPSWTRAPRWGSLLWRDAFHPHEALKEIRPGAVVSVQGRGEAADLVIPALDLHADTDTDEIQGLVSPNHRLQIHVSTRVPGDPTRVGMTFDTEVPVQAGGDFAATLAGRFDLRAGDTIEARVFTPDGHRVTQLTLLPYFDLNWDNGWITGGFGPPAIGLLPVTATLRRGEAVVAQTVGETDWWTFMVPLRDAAGAPAVPLAGDRVEVEIGTPDHLLLLLDMPNLSATMDWDTARLRGRLSSPGSLELSAGTQFAYPWPDADGGFDTLILRPGATTPWAFPGNGARLNAYLPSGHTISRSFIFPRLSLEVGGVRLQALVAPMSPISAELLNPQGQVIGRGEAVAKEYPNEGYDGDTKSNAVLTLRAEEGAGDPVRMQPGLRLRVVAGSAVVQTVVPDFQASVDWANDRLEGRSPAGSPLWRGKEGNRGCRIRSGFRWESAGGGASNTLSARPDGSFSYTPYSNMGYAAGDRFRVTMQASDGHLAYRVIQRPSAKIDPVRGTVEGCSQPLEPISLDLRDESGDVHTAEVTADADGRYAATFRTPAGEPVPMQPSDKLRVCAIGHCTEVPVQRVSVRFDGDAAIEGHVVGGLPAFIEAIPRYPFTARPEYPQIEGGIKKYWYPYIGELVAGAAGQFRLADSDLPPQYRPWGIADLEAVRVWSVIGDGFYLTAVASPNRHLYLPRAEVQGPRRVMGSR